MRNLISENKGGYVMKRIIVAASRRDDIIRRRDEYDRKKANNEAIQRKQYDAYAYDQSRVFAGVEDAIRTQLGDKLGELNINVDSRFGALLSVKIGNDLGGPRRDPNAALTWSWEATLKKDGTVDKESSSWSGLEAVTMEQVQDLKRSVEQLEIINSMDWKQLLDVSLPNWEDYIDDSQLEDLGPRPDFDTELMEADLEDGIGQNVLFLANGGGKAYNGKVYYQILRDSGTQYTVVEVPARIIDDLLAGKSYGDVTTVADYVERNGYQSRVRKATLMNQLARPIEPLSF